MRAQACVYERACMCCKCLQWQARQTKDLRVMSAQACVHERAVRCSECLQLQARQTNCSPALRRGRHAWWSRAAPTTFQRLSTSLRAGEAFVTENAFRSTLLPCLHAKRACAFACQSTACYGCMRIDEHAWHVCRHARRHA